MTDDQARALHDAVEAREAAWRNFDSAVKMPRDAANASTVSPAGAAEAWIAADGAVRELSLAVGIVDPVYIVEGGHGTTQIIEGAPGKRRGRPPKARTEAEVRGEGGAPLPADGDPVTP